MDNIFVNISSIGLGYLSVAQHASGLDEEKICPGVLASLRAQASPSIMNQGRKVEPPLISAKNSGNCLAEPNTSFRVSYVEIGLLHKCILGSYC